jgi:putative DNA primase/helicase
VSTAPTRRRRQPPVDPFDTSGIVDTQAERDCLAALIWTTIDKPKDAIEIVEKLTPEAFTITWGAEITRAVVEALRKPAPKLTNINAALKADIERQAFDPTDAITLVDELMSDRSIRSGVGLEWKIAQTASELAQVVQELHVRRQTVLACQDAVHRARDGRPMPEELKLAACRLGEVADLVEGRQSRGRRLRVRLASEIEPLPIEWLWPRRISRGSLTIITGMPGLSKSLLTIDIAARITTGGRWPDGTGSADQGGVILFGMEDDPERVVVPRLRAANADLDLVRIVDGAEDGRTEWLSPVSIDRDLDLVREQLDAFPECRAVVFDPLSQFVDVEENSNAQTRAALAPLVTLAQERGVSIIGVMHLNKKTDTAMIQRIAGASSYGQMARQIIFVGHDPDDPTTGQARRRAMIVAKSSYGGQDTGQLYRVVSRSGDQPGIEWIQGTVERDAESLNPRPSGVSREYEERRGEAVDALRAALAAGPRPGRDVENELEDLGFKRRQVDYAAKTLGVIKRQASDGGRRAWTWSLPLGDAAEPEDYAAAGMTPLDQWRPPK